MLDELIYQNLQTILQQDSSLDLQYLPLDHKIKKKFKIIPLATWRREHDYHILIGNFFLNISKMRLGNRNSKNCNFIKYIFHDYSKVDYNKVLRFNTILLKFIFHNVNIFKLNWFASFDIRFLIISNSKCVYVRIYTFICIYMKIPTAS